MPKVYKSLKTVAESCLQRIQFDEDAKKVFDSDRVQQRLRSMMELIIESLALISRFYQKKLYS